MTATIEKPTITYRKHACGFCTSGLHHLCKVATWNPGSKTPEPIYCACTDARCEGKRPVCRDCGYDPGPTVPLGPELVCLDRAECMLRVSQRLEDDPIHQLILECQRTRLVDGEVVERPRRATPAERAAKQAAKQAAVARGCTCGCGGTTKGGAFLPGHDARLISQLVKAGDPDAGRAALAPFPALLAKYEKRI